MRDFRRPSDFCVARKIIRLPASAASIALIDMSRPTNKREHHIGKDDDIPNRQQRKLVGNFNVLRRLKVLLVWVGHDVCPFFISKMPADSTNQVVQRLVMHWSDVIFFYEPRRSILWNCMTDRDGAMHQVGQSVHDQAGCKMVVAENLATECPS